ncbi:MAG: hypothetical protein Tsb006_0690 [Rickettsiaceae bacterium]
MDLKNIIRKKILADRKTFDEFAYVKQNRKIVEEVEHILKTVTSNEPFGYTNKKLVCGLYWPMKGEPDLLKLAISDSWSSAIPKILGTKMDFFYYKPGFPIELSNFNKLMQPKNNTKLLPDVVIIPGLAYSVNGHRLGFGTGHYDRYFTKLGTQSKIIKIGVCFHDYLFEYLPKEPHDIKMDYVITDSTIVSL